MKVLKVIGLLLVLAGVWWVAVALRMETQPTPVAATAGRSDSLDLRVEMLELAERRSDHLLMAGSVIATGIGLFALALLIGRRRYQPLYDADSLLTESVLTAERHSHLPSDGFDMPSDITEPGGLPTGDPEEIKALADLDAAGYTVYRDINKWIVSDGRGGLQNIFSRSDLIYLARSLADGNEPASPSRARTVGTRR